MNFLNLLFMIFELNKNTPFAKITRLWDLRYLFFYKNENIMKSA